MVWFQVDVVYWLEVYFDVLNMFVLCQLDYVIVNVNILVIDFLGCWWVSVGIVNLIDYCYIVGGFFDFFVLGLIDVIYVWFCEWSFGVWYMF